MFSILIPVFNEEGSVEATVRGVHASLQRLEEEWEILVMDDGSTDATPQLLQTINLPRVRIITHPYNRGNGSAIQTGIREARGDILGTIDADGTYPVGDFPRLLKEMHKTGADMLVGARPRNAKTFSTAHRIAKRILTRIAERLTGTTIPDINSGMRLFRRSLAAQFAPLSPQRFSFHITLTIAALRNDRSVHCTPISYGERVGTSKLSHGMGGVRHFCKFLFLIPAIFLRSGMPVRTKTSSALQQDPLVH